MKNYLLAGALAFGVFLVLKSMNGKASTARRGDGVTVYDTQGRAFDLLQGADGIVRDQKGNIWA